MLINQCVCVCEKPEWWVLKSCFSLDNPPNAIRFSFLFFNNNNPWIYELTKVAFNYISYKLHLVDFPHGSAVTSISSCHLQKIDLELRLLGMTWRPRSLEGELIRLRFGLTMKECCRSWSLIVYCLSSREFISFSNIFSKQSRKLLLMDTITRKKIRKTAARTETETRPISK